MVTQQTYVKLSCILQNCALGLTYAINTMTHNPVDKQNHSGTLIELKFLNTILNSHYLKTCMASNLKDPCFNSGKKHNKASSCRLIRTVSVARLDWKSDVCWLFAEATRRKSLRLKGRSRRQEQAQLFQVVSTGWKLEVSLRGFSTSCTKSVLLGSIQIIENSFSQTMTVVL